MKYLSLYFISIFSLMITFSCNQAKEKVSQIAPDQLGLFVSGYMPSSIQATDAIRVRFVHPIVDESEIGKPVKNQLFEIEPTVDGVAVWEDVHTFRFKPNDHFDPMEEYILSFDKELILKENAKALSALDFHFSVLPIEIAIEFDEVKPSESSESQSLTGRLFTAIPLLHADLEKMITAIYPISNPTISWEHMQDQKTHSFVISDIRRGNQPEVLTVKWDGKKLKSKIKGQRSLTIPAAGDFKVVGFDVNQSGGKEISIFFSDVLKPDQILDGLVRIKNYDQPLKTDVRAHQLIVYPGELLKGAFQVTLDQSIKSADGKSLGETNHFDLSFEDIIPQMRVLGRGVIVPNSEDVIFPFEAVNLTGVTIEIFEIFENNVMQFLQYQELDRSWGVEPVGRIIAQENVALDITENDRNTWKRFGLDLSKYTNLAPGSIYQVRLAFNRDNILYACQGIEDEMPQVQSSDEALETIMRYNFDYPGFNYEQTEDPCYPAYYNPDRFIQRNVLASNLGIIAKFGPRETMTVSVHDLRTTNPLPGVQISVFDFQQQLISTSSTNSNGYCQVTKSRQPYFVVADQNGEKGYLKLGDATARAMSDFDVSGVTPSNGMKGFIYAERDVWRPGDTVFLNFILEEESSPETTHPATCTLINPKGQRLYSMTKTNAVGPIYSFYFDTDPNDVTGNWRVEVKVGGVSFYKMIKIETIQPNRLKIIVDSEDGIKAFESTPEVRLESRWLHGAPASGLKAKMEMQLLQDKKVWQGYTGYSFLDPTRIADSRVMTIFEDNLNEEGRANVSLKNIRNEQLPGLMKAAFKTRVFEPGGNFSSDQYRAEFHPFDSYVGVKLPTSRWGSKELDIDVQNLIEIVSIDASGSPNGSREITVGLYQSEWRWWWDRTDRSLAQFNSSVHTGSFFTDTIQTDGNGLGSISVQPEAYGMYLIRVCDVESGHCSGDFYYAGELWDEYQERNAAVKLVLSADEEDYQIGNQATISIPSAEGSSVIVSLENHDGVVRSERIVAQGNTTKYTFDITDEMHPNVYAHVSLIQPHNNGNNDLPMRMYGVLPITVQNPDLILEPQIEMPDELSPGEAFTLKINEKQKKPMAYTIAIVDEGLLDLTRYKTPDPHNYFHAKEALGLHTWDIYDYVLGNYGGRVDRIITVGGDASSPEVQSVEEVNRFKPVVKHLGPFFLKAGEEGVHRVKLPNYVGSVRTMVVAADDNRYGAVEETTQVKQPLMILSTLPRVLSPGEQLSVPVHVFAMEKEVKNVTVNLRSNEKVEVIGASEKSIRFDQIGDQMITFDILVKNVLGPVSFEIEALSGRHSATSTIEIEVLNPNPVISEISEKTLKSNEIWTPDYSAIGMRGSQEAMLEIYSIYPFNLDKRLKYLLRYPYGCIEQTVSSAFPQLYIPDLLELTEQQKVRIRTNIQAAILKLRSFLNPAGGYSYWPGTTHVNAWSNSYAGHFLIEAKNAGYFVDQDLLDHWFSYQRKFSRNFEVTNDTESGKYHSLLSQAYRLYTMALHGTPEFGEMNRLRNANDLPVTARALLAAAYGSVSQSDPVEELIGSITTEIPEYSITGMTYGSDLRDRALLVETFLLLDKRSEAAPILRRISEDLSNNRWYSTQSTAFALKAISSFLRSAPQKGLHFSFSQNGAAKQLVKVEKPIFQISLSENQSGNYAFSIENMGGGDLFARVIRRGQPIDPILQGIDSHLKLRVNYLKMNGEKMDPASVLQGTDFIAEVEVINPGSLRSSVEELALQQIFPSGWEIINQRMDVFADALKNDVFDFQDIRDDRIYTFFDLTSRKSKVYRVGLNAAYAGHFLMPAIQCEAMYDHSMRSLKPGQWVEVIPAQNSIAQSGGN